jgi:signal transduction histidine kinase
LYDQAARLSLPLNSSDGTRRARALRQANIDSGVGLAGMRERINELNGQFEIESSTDTTVRASMPLDCLKTQQSFS